MHREGCAQGSGAFIADIFQMLLEPLGMQVLWECIFYRKPITFASHIFWSPRSCPKLQQCEVTANVPSSSLSASRSHTPGTALVPPARAGLFCAHLTCSHHGQNAGRQWKSAEMGSRCVSQEAAPALTRSDLAVSAPAAMCPTDGGCGHHSLAGAEEGGTELLPLAGRKCWALCSSQRGQMTYGCLVNIPAHHSPFAHIGHDCFQ